MNRRNALAGLAAVPLLCYSPAEWRPRKQDPDSA
jgi:hypothetical protein